MFRTVDHQLLSYSVWHPVSPDEDSPDNSLSFLWTYVSMVVSRSHSDGMRRKVLVVYLRSDQVDGSVFGLNTLSCLRTVPLETNATHTLAFYHNPCGILPKANVWLWRPSGNETAMRDLVAKKVRNPLRLWLYDRGRPEWAMMVNIGYGHEWSLVEDVLRQYPQELSWKILAGRLDPIDESPFRGLPDPSLTLSDEAEEGEEQQEV